MTNESPLLYTLFRQCVPYVTCIARPNAQLQAIVPPVSALGGQSSSSPSTPSSTPGPIMSGGLSSQHQQSQSGGLTAQQLSQQQQQGLMAGHGSMGNASTSYAGTSGLSKSQQQQVSSGVAPTGGMPTAADFSLMLSLGLGLNPADASQLANLDLQKLAMYLVSIKWWDRTIVNLLVSILFCYVIGWCTLRLFPICLVLVLVYSFGCIFFLFKI